MSVRVVCACECGECEGEGRERGFGGSTTKHGHLEMSLFSWFGPPYGENYEILEMQKSKKNNEQLDQECIFSGAWLYWNVILTQRKVSVARNFKIIKTDRSRLHHFTTICGRVTEKMDHGLRLPLLSK